MRISRIIWMFFLALILVGSDGCKKGPSSTHQKNKKKVKRGKPLPCPIKDC